MFLEIDDEEDGDFLVGVSYMSDFLGLECPRFTFQCVISLVRILEIHISVSDFSS